MFLTLIVQRAVQVYPPIMYSKRSSPARHAYNPNCSGGGNRKDLSSRLAGAKKLVIPHFGQQAGVVVHTCCSGYTEGMGRRIVV
jgi:hypothetical protein